MFQKFLDKLIANNKKYQQLLLVNSIADHEEKRLINKIAALEKEMVELKNPQKILKIIIDNGVPWFDYTELDREPLEDYKWYAQSLLTNPVFVNEINFLIQNYAKKALDTVTNLNDLEKIRHEAIGMKMLEERVKSIPKPGVKDEEVQEPFAAI